MSENMKQKPASEKSGKKLPIYIYVILGVCIMGVLIFAAKNMISLENSFKVSLDFYYPEATTSVLKSEKREIEGDSQEQILGQALKMLKEIPATDTFILSVPSDVDFIGESLDGKTAVIDVSSTYNKMTAGEELVCRASIVWTLTGLEFVDNVKITVEGKPLTKTNGEPMGAMDRDDIVIDTVISTEPTNTVEVKLYFSNHDATGLTAETRAIEVNPNQPIEKYVMEQLILGPATEGLYPTVPPETKIKDIKTVDGVCYLDLSKEFVTKHNGGTNGELLTIYSIVNSLTEIENIDKVQFLIEGEKQEEFKGHVEFSAPFEAEDLKL